MRKIEHQYFVSKANAPTQITSTLNEKSSSQKLALDPPRHDLKIVDCVVKPQYTEKSYKRPLFRLNSCVKAMFKIVRLFGLKTCFSSK